MIDRLGPERGGGKIATAAKREARAGATPVRLMLLILLAIGLLALTVWGGLVLRYSPLVGESLRGWLSGLWLFGCIVAVTALTRQRWRQFAVLAILVGVGIVSIGWGMIAPSNTRDWQRDVAVLPSATVEGDFVTIRNIRNADYRSESDFDLSYYDKTFDLRQLESVDLVAVYWMGPAIAHTMLSFGFAGKDFIAISIEARKERSETYSSVKGFFRQYELVYVVADERDVLRLRTNYRMDPQEDVYLYRLPSEAEGRRRLFLDYVRSINELHQHPAWYNSATSNCTGNIWLHATVNPGRIPFSWRILLSGYLPEYLHDMNRLVPGVPFAELRSKGLVNARARAADQSADFSLRIREGLPGYEPVAVGTDQRVR